MIPPSTLPPDDSSCWKWWDAFKDGELVSNSSPQKGCDYAPCQDAVCACDSYCCETAWDLSCRGYELEPGDTTSSKYFSNGCSARLLCCEQDTAFSKSLQFSTSTTYIPAMSPTKSPAFLKTIPISNVPIKQPTLPVPPNIIFVPAPTNVPTTTQQPTPMINATIPVSSITNMCSTMIPPSKLVPNNSTCWQWHDPNNNQNKPLAKGCDYKPCEDAVCACDDYCCAIVWDLSCRGYNNNHFIEGCSASFLCCEQNDSFPKPPVYVAYSSIRRYDFNN